MITADRLKFLTTMSADKLTEGIRRTGYKKDKFETAKFVGISNAGLFVYTCEFVDEDGDMEACQVFVKNDPAEDRVLVDY